MAAWGVALQESQERGHTQVTSHTSMRDEFTLVKTLRGAIYGRVALVRHRATDAIYAMKLMSLTHMSMQRAVSGPVVREDGSTELRVLRRISGNRIMAQQGGFNGDASEFHHDPDSDDVDRSSCSVHPLWEAWGKPQHSTSTSDANHHHHLLMLHADFVDERANARCLVFDYCPYGELYDQLQRTPSKTLGVETARVCFRQIATAIRFIHAQNIAHRDVSLENVLVDANRQCRLGDFGLSCEYGTMCSGRVGKAFYMAPEVYAWQPGELYNGLQADMWSLGIVLFIMVTGAPPVEAPNEIDARFRVIMAKGIAELLAMWRLDAKLPLELCDLLALLLCVDPEARVDIEAVWVHPWLQDPVDAQVLAMEGTFCEWMVDHDQSTKDKDRGMHKKAVGKVRPGEEEEEQEEEEEEEEEEERCEPQEEIEAEGPVTFKAKRHRKRIKITIDDDDATASSLFSSSSSASSSSSTLTGSRVAGFFGGPVFDADFLASVGIPPPQLRHEPPPSGGEISPGGAYRSAVEPLTSPMVWPTVRGETALRSRLFVPKDTTADDEMDDVITAETSRGDASGTTQPCSNRTRRLDSSSCSNHKRDQQESGEDPPQSGAVVLCRFCLRWVESGKCANQVTLPTHQRNPTSSSNRDSATVQTRRVCDACFLTISAALPHTNGATTTSGGSGGSGGSSSSSSSGSSGN